MAVGCALCYGNHVLGSLTTNGLYYARNVSRPESQGHDTVLIGGNSAVSFNARYRAGEMMGTTHHQRAFAGHHHRRSFADSARDDRGRKLRIQLSQPTGAELRDVISVQPRMCVTPLRLMPGMGSPISITNTLSRIKATSGFCLQ